MCSTEVATAMQGTIISVKLCIVPVKRGYWENKVSKLTSGCDLSCVSSLPPETPVPKQPLLMAGIKDSSTSAKGCTAILSSFAKATFDATSNTYSFLIPTSGRKLYSPRLLTRNSLSSL